MVNEIVEEYKKGNENRVNNLLSSVTPIHLIVFGVLVLIAYSITKNNKDTNMTYIIYAVLFGVIIVLLYKPSKEKRLLPREVVVRIVKEEAEKMRRMGVEFSFDSKIFVKPHCHLKYENDMTTGTSGPVSWEVGVDELVHGTQYKKTFVFFVHPYEGIITGVDERVFGFKGIESRDRDVVPVGVVQGNIKTTDFGGMPK
jgi:hypothetical protein